MTIRPYEVQDKEALLNILKLNMPRYFDVSEAEDLDEYLDHLREEYFVMEENGIVIGAGGINYFPQENNARISWDYIHPDYHGKGFGSELVKYRLKILRANEAIHNVVVRTTQLSFPFYQKQGFELEKMEEDYWAPGFDLYQMRMSRHKLLEILD